jgi:dihydroorotate dehydrogenase
MTPYRFARRLLFRLDAERAHGLAKRALRGVAAVPPLAGRLERRNGAGDPRLAQDLLGRRFASPVGLAAGFDKDGEVIAALPALGFGFAEIGTVTPRPQAGNPRPRLFRLEADEAVINRLGFNSAGHDAVLERLKARRPSGIVGINIGANKDSADRIADYVGLVEAFSPVASYFTLNVSSPNTPGLRDLQHARALDDLLARVMAARDRAVRGRPKAALLLKIAPDLALGDLDDVVGIARSRRIDGMVVGNTTLMRPASLREQTRAIEQGGLSGRPLFRLATRMLAETYVRVEDQFPLVGVGGIDSGAAAFAKIKAGATLLQVYTGLIFRGVGLVSAIKSDLLNFLRLGRYEHLTEAVGVDAAAVTAESWPD